MIVDVSTFNEWEDQTLHTLCPLNVQDNMQCCCIYTYSQSASFRCPQEECVGNGDFIRLHVAGASEATTIRNDLNCVACGHKLEEDVKYRNLGSTYVCMYVCIIDFVHNACDTLAVGYV